ncbi:MAG TPA: hypothetical protein VFR34_10995, partial [Paracoccaceae bacterium]|nr:hypothetical protein [Paracoccaceae bacterium]
MRISDPALNGAPKLDAALRHAPLSFVGFVALMGGLLGINALAIDIMLPGLPDIAASLGATSTTEAQLTITAYLL